ncbi:unnamed protein product [Amaranthus hypochondriacus]
MEECNDIEIQPNSFNFIPFKSILSHEYDCSVLADEDVQNDGLNKELSESINEDVAEKDSESIMDDNSFIIPVKRLFDGEGTSEDAEQSTNKRMTIIKEEKI